MGLQTGLYEFLTTSGFFGPGLLTALAIPTLMLTILAPTALGYYWPDLADRLFGYIPDHLHPERAGNRHPAPGESRPVWSGDAELVHQHGG